MKSWSAVGYSWNVKVRSSAAEPHDAWWSAAVHVIAVAPPEHRIAIKISSHGTEVSLEEVHVRVGAFKAITDREGVATVELPTGTYDVSAWKAGYEIASTRVNVTGSMDIALALVAVPEPEEEYWM